MANAATANGPPERTLNQINQKLSEFGFPKLTADQAKFISSEGHRNSVLYAVEDLGRSDRASAYLTNLFRELGFLSDQQGGNSDNDAPRGSGGPRGIVGGNEPSNASGGKTTAAQAGQNQSGQPNTSAGGGQNSASQQPQNPPQSGGDQAQPSGQGQNNSNQGAANNREFISHHVYGGKAALCFNVSQTRREFPTVSLDAAQANGSRSYDWSQKIAVQLTQDELPVVAAVFLGVIKSCKFDSHGEENNKGFSAEVQDKGKIFVNVFTKGAVRAVPIEASDRFYVASILIRQLKKANPWLDDFGIFSLIKATQA